MYTVEGAIQTPASLEEVWSVLTDYEGLSAVFSNIKSSAVASRHPEIVLRQVPPPPPPPPSLSAMLKLMQEEAIAFCIPTCLNALIS